MQRSARRLAVMGGALVFALVCSPISSFADADQQANVDQACQAWNGAMAHISDHDRQTSRQCRFAHVFDTQVTPTVRQFMSSGTDTAVQGSTEVTAIAVRDQAISNVAEIGDALVTNSTGTPQNGTSQAFTLCGSPDSMLAQSIGQFIGGRPFSSELTGRSDGCSDLTVTVASEAAPIGASSQQTTSLSITSGAQGDTRTVALTITSVNGGTQVRIGNGS